MSFEARKEELSNLSDQERIDRKQVLKSLRKKYQARRRELAAELGIGHECQLCHREVDKIELHHKQSLRDCLEPDQQWKADDASNLIGLCCDCHSAFHKIYEDDLDWEEYVAIDREEAWEKLRLYRNKQQKSREEHRRRRRLRWQAEVA